MDFNEALNELIDAVTDVEEHGDAIELLQNYDSERDGETDTTWKDKYIKLESEYKKRFKEKMKASASNTDKNDNTKVEREEEISVEDLDFNGKTE
jgi:hypothetical protein|nr:MAG TPA: hypothetical protein [Caudoviricetes sp.]